MNIEAKKAFARAELALADYYFKKVQLAGATGHATSGSAALSVEAGSSSAKANERRIVPEFLRGLHAARGATAYLESVVQHGRSF